MSYISFNIDFVKAIHELMMRNIEQIQIPNLD